jgi:hypothetical protein
MFPPARRMSTLAPNEAERIRTMEQLYSLVLSLAALCNFVVTNKPPCPNGAATQQTTAARTHSVPPGRRDDLRWLMPVVVLEREWADGPGQALPLRAGGRGRVLLLQQRRLVE